MHLNETNEKEDEESPICRKAPFSSSHLFCTKSLPLKDSILRISSHVINFSKSLLLSTQFEKPATHSQKPNRHLIDTAGSLMKEDIERTVSNDTHKLSNPSKQHIENILHEIDLSSTSYSLGTCKCKKKQNKEYLAGVKDFVIKTKRLCVSNINFRLFFTL